MTRSISRISVTSIFPPYAKEVFGIKGTSDTRENTVERHGKYWSLSEDQCAICAENASSVLTEPGYEIYSSQETSVPSETDGTTAPRHPLHIPYLTNCGHKYCYSCISDLILRATDEGEEPWVCLRCEERVLTVDRAGNENVEDLASSRSDLELEDASLASEDFLTSASEDDSIN
jgi:peroxin-2